VKERPILFSAPMVRALLDDDKTQTRRIVKPQPAWQLDGFSGWAHWIKGGLWRSGMPTEDRCPYGRAGDRLWVRETWTFINIDSERGEVCIGYNADGEALPNRPSIVVPEEAFEEFHEKSFRYFKNRKRPSIFMPRWASRITLEISDVRVERPQDISIEDAEAEGLACVTKDGTLFKYGIPDMDGLPGTDDHGWPWMHWRQSPVDAYEWLWQSIHGEGSWASNPWVWALTFKRVQA
jgi:hypothetical protein